MLVDTLFHLTAAKKENNKDYPAYLTKPVCQTDCLTARTPPSPSTIKSETLSMTE